MTETSDQLLQYLGQGIAWVLGFIQPVWTWSSDQIVRLTQTPWETWPLWKQILLIIVVALVAYALFIAARQLLWAVLNLLYAFATFLRAVILTLPTILIAGVIALAGLWVINNFHDLSSLRSLISGHTSGSPIADQRASGARDGADSGLLAGVIPDASGEGAPRSKACLLSSAASFSTVCSLASA